jgi:hypothetical protein
MAQEVHAATDTITVDGAKYVRITPVHHVKKDSLPPSLLYLFYFGNREHLLNNPYWLDQIAHNPAYYRLWMPNTYYDSPIRRLAENLAPKELSIYQDSSLIRMAERLLPFDKEKYERAERTQESIDKVLLTMYLNDPFTYRRNINDIRNVKAFRTTALAGPASQPIRRFLQPELPPEQETPEAQIIARRPNFWTYGGNGSLQFTQNYISPNWYKGGESANALIGNLLLSANYNDKQYIEFENSFEIKNGFTTTSGDSLHSVRINTDIVRIYSKLGIKAIQRWYYTATAEFNTQFFNNYKSNSTTLSSAFFAPANFIVSLGMDWKMQKDKINFSLLLSPLTYNWRYVGNKAVDVTAFGIEEGKRSRNFYGSKAQVDMDWKILPILTWKTRFYYFTSYETVQSEWENTLNFILNRYLSTQLFVHGRFDDGAARKEGRSYFQLKEILSFGINYKW